MIHNVVILGSGIAGLTAAVYAARANLRPLVISGYEEGGQLTLTTDVENFPGFENGIGGTELVQQARKQAERFGTTFKFDRVMDIEHGDVHTLQLESGDTVQAHSIIVATGASARWLNIASEEKFKGRGVTTCATCDGAFYKGKEVIVIGGGDSAMEEATFLTKFATKVTIVHRRDEFRASKIMQDRALNHEKIDVLWNKEVIEITGDNFVDGVMLKDTVTGEETPFSCQGVFLAIGHIPNTFFLKHVSKDDHGYILTDRYMHTNVDGLFAAGDVQDTRYRQAITAAGSGCAAALEVEHYLVGKGIE